MNHSILVSALALSMTLFAVVPPVGSLLDVASIRDDLGQDISLAFEARTGHTIGCIAGELATATALVYTHPKLLVSSKSVVLLPTHLAAGYRLPCRDVIPPRLLALLTGKLPALHHIIPRITICHRGPTFSHSA